MTVLMRRRSKIYLGKLAKESSQSAAQGLGLGHGHRNFLQRGALFRVVLNEIRQSVHIDVFVPGKKEQGTKRSIAQVKWQRRVEENK